MKSRQLILVIAAILATQCILGCSIFNRRNENLPAGRRVKMVVFPMRHLKYSNMSCTQEYENVELSGAITNVSPYTLPNVGVYTKMFFAGSVPVRAFTIATTPAVLQPGETATFSFTAIVDDPLAQVELHGTWTE